MLDFVKAEKEINEYLQHVIMYNNIRYVPATGFEFLQRMYEEQKVFVSKLEERLIELENKLSAVTNNRNKKRR